MVRGETNMIGRALRWNLAIQFRQRELLWAPLAGLFYLAVSYVQLLPAREGLTPQAVQLVVYGGMAAGEFTLLPPAKMGVYLALFVRVLANTAQQRDSVLPYCVSRCASCRAWVAGELNASLLLACLWALQLLCCEFLLCAVFHETPFTGARALVSVQLFLLDTAAFFSVAALFAALNTAAGRALSASLCVLLGVMSLVFYPLCFVLPYGFCFALRTRLLGGEGCAGPLALFGLFGVHYLLLFAFLFHKREAGSKGGCFDER